MDPYSLQRYRDFIGNPKATPDPSLKGKRGANCNRTACQRPRADYYSIFTQSYYCADCADLINTANRRDCLRSYEVPDGVFIVADLSAERRRLIEKNGQRVPEE